MIIKITGKLIEKKDQAVIISVQGFTYEVLTPASVVQRIEETLDEHGNVNLITYHYVQTTPAGGFPILVGFVNEIEKDFFLQIITVSGIGPRAAIRALIKPISEITQAIDNGDVNYLKGLPGIGNQKAKEIVAKLQGKVGRFGLIQDKKAPFQAVKIEFDWQEEALQVLLQLQYKKQEAADMIQKALERSPRINTTEELLNEIYKQKVKK